MSFTTCTSISNINNNSGDDGVSRATVAALVVVAIADA